MEIFELKEEYKKSYFVCFEDWSDEMKEAGNHKEVWYQKMKDLGLGVKIALNDDGQPAGMIQYIPIEYSFVKGKDLYFILCIWVHGYKNKGIGNNQKQGMGKALIKAAEEDVIKRGAKGLVAWGLPIPVFMRASWFKKQGYVQVDKEGFLGRVLLWKPFSKDAVPPKWIPAEREPQLNPDKVMVNAYISGWCPAYNMSFERAKRAADELGEAVEFRETNILGNNNTDEGSNSDLLFINKKKINTGPPPSYAKLKKKISKEIKKQRILQA